MTGYKWINFVTNSIDQFYFAKPITDEDEFIHITISQGAYEIESLNNGTERAFIEQGQLTEADYPFTTRNFQQRDLILKFPDKSQYLVF